MAGDKEFEKFQQLRRLSELLADQGKIIEGGWVCLATTLPKGASILQVAEMRKTFFAGAQHLFASIMSIMEPGMEPTEKEIHRVQLIADELDAFVKTLRADSRLSQ